MESREAGRQRCIINENIMREFRFFCLKLQVQTVRFALLLFLLEFRPDSKSVSA